MLLCVQTQPAAKETPVTNTKIPVPPGKDRKDAGHDSRPEVRMGAHGGTYGNRGELHADINGLDSRELDLLKGAMHGHQWVTCQKGRLKNVPAYDPLPGPAQDEALMPFWSRPIPDEGVQLSLFSFEPVPAWSSPSITISHLCGYHYSEENYRQQAQNLAHWGFVCMRSQRDDSGQFHEHWYLPGLWAAKGELKLVIDALDPYILDTNRAEKFLRGALFPPKRPSAPKNEKERQKRQLETAVSYLSRNAKFGALDVSIQRAAMAVSD